MDEVTSTNDVARRLRSEDTGITLITAEFQTGGRGAGTNRWESERGQNLLLSLLCHPQNVLAPQMFSLLEALALAVHKAMTETMHEKMTIKWPNDIYYGDHKICGMLIENELSGKHIAHCVMGVGINVNQRVFLSDAPNPTSMAIVKGCNQNRQQLLEKLKEAFLYYINKVENGESLHEEYLSHLYRKDGLHYPFADEQGTFVATIETVEPSGHLLLRDKEGGQRRYAFKEVSYILTK